MDRFVIALEGELLGALDRAIGQVQRPRELMDNIGGLLESSVAIRFVTKQDPNGAPWAPLTKATLARKAGRGSTLVETGFMRDSLTHNPSDQFVEIGFSDPKAAYHETGTKRGGKPAVPRRGLLTGDPEAGRLGAEDSQAIESEIAAWLGGIFD